MNLFNFIAIYLDIVVLCGMCIEALMAETNLNEDTTYFERFLWFTFWPIFTVIFLFGMKK
jgi:hypothetical protein